jgi:rubredoxin
MGNCKICGFSFDRLKENTNVNTKYYTCPSCGAILDPPIVVTVNESIDDIREYKKLLG